MQRLLVALAVLLSSQVVSCGRPAQPKGPRADAVTLQAASQNQFVKAGIPAQLTVRVALGVAPIERNGRPPANLALVVDTSGSMEGKAIEDARAAALALVDSLSPKDRLSVVVFNSKTDVLLPSTLLDDADMKEVRAKLHEMRAEGTTDMAKGLEAGIQQVTSHLDPEGVNRVILLGDGVPNDEGPIDAMVQGAAARGVSVTALGLGPDYNETLMGRIAQVSGGKFQYVADSSKVASFFKEEVGRLQKTYARDAWLDLTAGPGVTVLSTIGQEIVRTPTGVRVHVGDLALGEKMDVIVKLAVTARKDGAVVELMDGVLTFNEGLAGTQAERRVFVGIHATEDANKLAKGKNADVENAAARAQQAADTLEQIRLARESDVPKPASPVSAGGGGGGIQPSAPLTARPRSQAFPAPAPADVRRQHDEAMNVLQKH